MYANIFDESISIFNSDQSLLLEQGISLDDDMLKDLNKSDKDLLNAFKCTFINYENCVENISPHIEHNSNSVVSCSKDCNDNNSDENSNPTQRVSFSNDEKKCDTTISTIGNTTILDQNKIQLVLDNETIKSCYQPININDPKPWKCPFYKCNKMFKQKYNLKTHYNIHTSTAFTCNICNKQFSRHSNFMDHLRYHSGQNQFFCSFCPKGFKQKHSLKDHLRTHTGERPFQCPCCNKTFAVKNNLKIHLRIHYNQKPYVCSMCDKAYPQKSSLNGHIKKKHSTNI